MVWPGPCGPPCNRFGALKATSEENFGHKLAFHGMTQVSPQRKETTRWRAGSATPSFRKASLRSSERFEGFGRVIEVGSSSCMPWTRIASGSNQSIKEGANIRCAPSDILDNADALKIAINRMQEENRILFGLKKLSLDLSLAKVWKQCRRINTTFFIRYTSVFIVGLISYTMLSIQDACILLIELELALCVCVCLCACVCVCRWGCRGVGVWGCGGVGVCVRERERERERE